MDKQYSFFSGVIVVLIGFFVGYLVWGFNNKSVSVMENNSKSASHEDIDLTGKTGDAFDKAFLEAMIPHHESAILMARRAFIASKRPQILRLASDIIASQSQEIDEMRDWKLNWFGSQVATDTIPVLK